VEREKEASKQAERKVGSRAEQRSEERSESGSEEDIVINHTFFLVIFGIPCLLCVPACE